MVSISQLIEWVKNPTTVDEITSFEPWGCPGVATVPCTVRTCPYDAGRTPFGVERFMAICNRACPTYFPWYENIDGDEPPTPWVP